MWQLVLVALSGMALALPGLTAILSAKMLPGDTNSYFLAAIALGVLALNFRR